MSTLQPPALLKPLSSRTRCPHVVRVTEHVLLPHPWAISISLYFNTGQHLTHLTESSFLKGGLFDTILLFTLTSSLPASSLSSWLSVSYFHTGGLQSEVLESLDALIMSLVNLSKFASLNIIYILMIPICVILSLDSQLNRRICRYLETRISILDVK